jgi:hypothetical protein
MVGVVSVSASLVVLAAWHTAREWQQGDVPPAPSTSKPGANRRSQRQGLQETQDKKNEGPGDVSAAWESAAASADEGELATATLTSPPNYRIGAAVWTQSSEGKRTQGGFGAAETSGAPQAAPAAQAAAAVAAVAVHAGAAGGEAAREEAMKLLAKAMLQREARYTLKPKP